MKQYVNTLPAGSVLDSGQHRYRIVKVLGQGGFGITYQAVAKIKVGNVTIDGFFAIKEHFLSSFCGRQGESVTIPNPSNAQEVNDSLNSFLTEAERLNRLSLEHDGLVKVNESFQANGTAYYVMEYIGGENLRQYVKRQPAGRLSEAEALPIINKVAEAVSYLHQNQVTHLDIKPDNILLRDDGTPVLIDFGLAKHYDKKGKATSTLKVAGCSDGYSPLEQYAGIDHFSPQADVYALAATLLYMLTGKDPRKASEMSSEQIEQSLPSDVSVATRAAIVHAMQMVTANRTASVSQFCSELSADNYTGETVVNEQVDEDNEEVVTVKRTKKQKSKWSRKTVMYAAASVIALLLVIGGIVVVANSNDSESAYEKSSEPKNEFEGMTAQQIAEIAEDENNQSEVAIGAINFDEGANEGQEVLKVNQKVVEEVQEVKEENVVFEVAEQMPSFPGGENALMEFLSKNTKYPSVAEENGIQGRVVCTFVVEANGSITNVKVVRGLDPALDREAVRVIKSMPKWIPGKQNGKTVRVTYTVPVTFKLE